jgi:hypothetical protein
MSRPYDEDDELEFDPESQSGMSELETPDNIANLPVSAPVVDIEPMSATDDSDFLEEARKSQPKPSKMDSDTDLESEVIAANPAASQATELDFTPEEDVQVQAGLDGMTQSLQSPIASPQNPALTRYQQFMDEYKRLQEKRASDQRLIGLMSAGSTIGQSIAGGASGNFKVDPNAYAMAEKIANRPVEDFEQGQVVNSRQMQLKNEMDSNDPASPKSALIRKYFKEKLNIPLEENVSAADAMELIKTVGRPSQTQTKTQQVTFVADGKTYQGFFDPYRNGYFDDSGKQHFNVQKVWAPTITKDPLTEQLTQVQRVAGEVPTAQPIKSAGYIKDKKVAERSEDPQQVYTNLTKAEQEQINIAKKDYVSETKEIRSNFEEIDSIYKGLDQAVTNSATAAQMGTRIASAFQKGVLSDKDVERYVQRKGLVNFIKDSSSRMASGTFSPSLVAELKEAMDLYRVALAKSMESNAQQKANLAAKRIPTKVDPKMIVPLISGEFAEKPTDDNLVDVISAKTGQKLKLPKNKVEEARKKGLIK